jgi:hypothetical protein
MAISDSGYIVSADYTSVEYYTENGAPILQHQSHNTFFGQISLDNSTDPRVIYDSYNKKFIMVTLSHSPSDSSKLIVSFSKYQNPLAGWKHYEIKMDTLVGTSNIKYWADYPVLGINKNEVFITANIFKVGTNKNPSNILLQINKAEGYSGSPLKLKKWNHITQANGDTAIFLYPLSDGLQLNSYNKGIWLVSLSKQDYNTENWYYRVTDNYNSPLNTIIKDSVKNVSYNMKNQYLHQFGTLDTILGTTARIQSGFYMNNKLHFVYRSYNDTVKQSKIFYNTLNVVNKNKTAVTYSKIPNNNDSTDYDNISICAVGADSSDEKVMLGFNSLHKLGYSKLCAVDYSPILGWGKDTVIKTSITFIDILPSLQERWGDYTTIQRRYNKIPIRCWLVGSYIDTASYYPPFPSITWQAHITELGYHSFTGISTLAQNNINNVILYPIPATNTLNMYIDVKKEDVHCQISIINLMGQICGTQYKSLTIGTNFINFNTQMLPSGYYMININSIKNKYPNEKFIIVH